jgi:hypothetical protein
MCKISLILKACTAHGLAVEWRPYSHCYAVFRPLTPQTICLFDAIDVVDPESAAMEWAMMDMFNDTNNTRWWRPV